MSLIECAHGALMSSSLERDDYSVCFCARNPDCGACGQEPSITAENLAAYDYGAFTGQVRSMYMRHSRFPGSYCMQTRCNHLHPALPIDFVDDRSHFCCTCQAADDAAPCQRLLPPGQRVSPEELAAKLSRTDAASADGAGPGSQPLLLDVRPADQFDMCHLAGAAA